MRLPQTQWAVEQRAVESEPITTAGCRMTVATFFLINYKAHDGHARLLIEQEVENDIGGMLCR